MKKLIVCLIAAVAVMAAAFGFSGCLSGINPETYSFITIDINPSVELLTLGNNVLDVKAANYDACVLLDGEDFSSLTVEQATEKIVSLAEEMGYLTESNNQVKITVISDDGGAVEILKNAAKAGAEKGSKKAEPVTATRLQDELTVKKLKDEDPDKYAKLTEEKVRLIEAVMEYDETMSYEKGADMTVNELTAALHSSIGENIEIVTSELRNEYSARYAAAKQEINRSIAAVFGDGYLAAWENYTAFENAYNQIVNALEKAGLSEEDTAEIISLLGITDSALIQKGGIVKPEYVTSYIDKHINKKGSEVSHSAVQQVKEILKSYELSRHVLSAEESAIIAAATQDETNYTTLSEVSAALALKKSALNAMEKSISLTEQQIAEIRNLKEGFASIRESVLEDMQETISSVQAEIAAAKQQRVNR